MSKKQHIVVSGGGLSGLTSAISLAMACPFFHITLIERSKLDMNLQTNQDARTSALSYVSAVFFHKLGIFANIKHNLGIIEDIRVIEGNNNPFYVHFNKQDANFFDCTLQMEDKADREDKSGKNEGESGVNSNNGNSDDDFCDTPPMGYIAQNNLLKQALLEKAYSIKNIHIIDNVAYEEIWQNAGGLIVIKLNNSNILEANLLINTEGKFSKLRQMAGLTTIESDYHQRAIIFNIKHQHPHNNTALEMFLANGPLALLPLKDANHSSVVFTESSRRSQVYQNMPQEEFLQHIVAKLGGYLGQIALTTERCSYPLQLSYAKNYKSEILPRCVTLGDACHTIHPIAGQGFNLSIRDIDFITKKVKQNGEAGIDASINLATEFEKHRKPANLAMIMATHGLNSLFANRLSLVKSARNLGMFGVNKLPFLKKHFIRTAMGLHS